YYGGDESYRAAIGWWMQERHGWTVEADWITTTHGLVNGTALCVDTWTDPGDGVVLFTPVYHAFAKVIRANGRRVVECPMVIRDGRYELDFDSYDALIDERTKMLVFCSPHNPGGRVWSRAELEAVAAFAKKHDLILVSDEIHHDLVMPGHRHVPMALIGGIEDRLVMMTASTKTFNLAGMHTGQVIIADEALRAQFSATMIGLGMMPNSFGMFMVPAVYSPEGAEWVDALMQYLDGNRRLFEEGMNAIPGTRTIPLQSTYLE
ncbi:MAG: aminotransferase class I/II-fold pyridoxal phosphate-dependent enzyme, partial [Bdellovibrionales bacterium]|nr:aminotransferase class I/II-fold pyridoxal phosphate-dependent enzyme [Bdellovibrionales bacterium]